MFVIQIVGKFLKIVFYSLIRIIDLIILNSPPVTSLYAVTELYQACLAANLIFIFILWSF